MLHKPINSCCRVNQASARFISWLGRPFLELRTFSTIAPWRQTNIRSGPFRCQRLKECPHPSCLTTGQRGKTVTFSTVCIQIPPPAKIQCSIWFGWSLLTSCYSFAHLRISQISCHFALLAENPRQRLRSFCWRGWNTYGEERQPATCDLLGHESTQGRRTPNVHLGKRAVN